MTSTLRDTNTFSNVDESPNRLLSVTPSMSFNLLNGRVIETPEDVLSCTLLHVKNREQTNEIIDLIKMALIQTK